MRVFFWFYLWFTRVIYFSPILSWFGVNQRRLGAFRKSLWKKVHSPPPGTQTTWFHAASTGELEILFPIIEEFVEKGIPTAVSIFSESAVSFLERLPQGLLYRGFSPPESEWRKMFQYYRVNRVVVSKYEAWPALWMACGDLGIPLLLINAQWRKSLSVVKRMIRIFGGSLPRLFLFVLEARQLSLLKEHFPEARLQKISDPRWIRIMNRAALASQNPNVNSWKLEAEKIKAEHPFVMVGSAWMEDLEVLVPGFLKHPGTLWVIPHSLRSESLRMMQAYLEEQIPGRFVLVKEMGILLELYSLADRVWVGGGFGAGIHSTMEPAIFSVPIGCGPKRVHEFYETHELIREGWLTVCEPEQAQDWFETQGPRHRFASEERKSEFSRFIEDCTRVR